MLNIPLSGIKKIEAIAQSSPEYISLSQGALKVGGIPQQIKQYVQSVLNTDKTDYYQSAWGIMELRKKLSEVLSAENKTKISPDQIIVTHGCIGALSTFLFTVLNQGDEVILPEPTYPAYEKLALLVRAKPVFVSLRDASMRLRRRLSYGAQAGRTENDWYLDIEKIKKATTPRTKVIIFSNPWNPLGIVVPQKTILELKEWCEENKIYMLVDEAYKEYAFDDSYQSVVPLVNQSDFVVAAASFSKNTGMSGWRVGYMVVPPQLCKNLGTTQDAMLNCPNVPAQHAAVYALDHPEFTQHFHQIIKNNLEITNKELKPLIQKKIFSYQQPKGSFFIFLKTEFPDATDFGMDILSKAKVSLVPGKFFGQSGAPFLRLCYARDTEILQEGLQRLVKYFL